MRELWLVMASAPDTSSILAALNLPTQVGWLATGQQRPFFRSLAGIAPAQPGTAPRHHRPHPDEAAEEILRFLAISGTFEI
jgi:hypothetical protein